MKIKLITPTKNTTANDQIEKINQTIEKLKEIILKLNSNVLTDDELYNEIIRLYHIGEGPHGKTEIFLNSQKYNFQFLKTNITIAKKLIIRNKKTNETSNKIFYYPCIVKVATHKPIEPNHYFTIEEIIELIKTRQIVLWDIVWPTTNFDPNNKYTKDIKEGYADLELYKCIYPNLNMIFSQNEINTILGKYEIQNKKMKTLKNTAPEQYEWILSFIKAYFTKEQLEQDKKELEREYKKLLENIKIVLIQSSKAPTAKKKTLNQKEHLLPQSQ